MPNALQSFTATPRNRLLGMIADGVQGVSDFAGKPFGYNNPPGQMLMSGLGVNDLATVLDRASYGERMTTGQGQTLQLRPEVVGAAGAVLPIAAAAPRVARAAGRVAEAGMANLAVPSDMAMQGQRGAVVLKPLQKEQNALVEDYRGTHRPPMSDNGGAPAHDLTGAGQVYPDDVYSSKAAQYYGHGENPAADAQLFSKLQALRGKPDAPVVVYRSVPTDVMQKYGNRINHGDWVTPSRDYAVEHGERTLNGAYELQRIQVPAKALYTNGDSPYEFGLDRIAGGLDP